MVMLLRVKKFIQNNIVCSVAFVLALITCIFVPIDREYIHYIDYKTIASLFMISCIIAAFKDINFFYLLARQIIIKFKTLRMSYLALITITFAGSMLIANDMALITFLPLGYLLLKETGHEDKEAFVFIMQNIAANLGGMLTPFGNPQNLYIYTKYNIGSIAFMKIMIIPFLVAIILLYLSGSLIENTELTINEKPVSIDKTREIVYVSLFILAVLIVFRVIHPLIGLIIIPTVIFIFDRRAFKSVDYTLLLVFVFFFIFSSNLVRIGQVNSFFKELLAKDVYFTTLISCQFMSNVPTSILLSKFTNDYIPLLYGVNIGGLGTLIASLASLITFRTYIKLNPKKALQFILLFTFINLIFIVIESFVIVNLRYVIH
jgi:Na+/H+ antiporter NhaD/arsenite permease-like protein